jgi:hypothetical protein
MNAAISWFFEKKHEIAKAVQEVTDFLDSPRPPWLILTYWILPYYYCT